MTRDYLVVREPRGRTYEALMRASLAYCDSFLIALPDMEFSDETKRLLAKLEPFLTSRDEVSEYPAAKLMFGTLTTCTYSLSPSSVAVLLEATDRLYDWQEPDWPNNLCLLKRGSPWLTTMASDREAVLSLDEREFEDVCTNVPGLKLVADTA